MSLLTISFTGSSTILVWSTALSSLPFFAGGTTYKWPMSIGPFFILWTSYESLVVLGFGFFSFTFTVITITTNSTVGPAITLPLDGYTYASFARLGCYASTLVSSGSVLTFGAV